MQKLGPSFINPNKEKDPQQYHKGKLKSEDVCLKKPLRSAAAHSALLIQPHSQNRQCRLRVSCTAHGADRPAPSRATSVEGLQPPRAKAAGVWQRAAARRRSGLFAHRGLSTRCPLNVSVSHRGLMCTVPPQRGADEGGMALTRACRREQRTPPDLCAPAFLVQRLRAVRVRAWGPHACSMHCQSICSQGAGPCRGRHMKPKPTRREEQNKNETDSLSLP